MGSCDPSPWKVGGTPHSSVALAKRWAMPAYNGGATLPGVEGRHSLQWHCCAPELGNASALWMGNPPSCLGEALLSVALLWPSAGWCQCTMEGQSSLVSGGGVPCSSIAQALCWALPAHDGGATLPCALLGSITLKRNGRSLQWHHPGALTFT